MRYLVIYLSVASFYSCQQHYTPQQIADDYCNCAQLPEDKKIICVKEWASKYKGTLKGKEEHETVNYKMIECNGFEGDKDFYLKLMKN